MLAIGGERSKEKLPSFGPSLLASGPFCLPSANAFSLLPLSRGRAGTTSLAPLFLASTHPFGSRRHSSNWGILSFLSEPLACWEDQNGDSSHWLCEELAGVHVLCHCDLQGCCKSKCLESDSVSQDPLSFLHLDLLNRSCFSLD